MKIINETTNKILWDAGQIFCVGYVSGPTRALGGVIQTIVNLVPAIFLIIPSLCNLIEWDSQWHASHFTAGCYLGVGHILRGIVETLPGTSFIFKHKYKPVICPARGTVYSKPYKDHPFKIDNGIGFVKT